MRSAIGHNMSLRIDRTTVGELTVLRVSGRLQSAEVPELEKEISSAAGRLKLDLSELMSADEAGIKRLRELAFSGAELHGASPYVQLLLDDQE